MGVLGNAVLIWVIGSAYSHFRTSLSKQSRVCWVSSFQTVPLRLWGPLQGWANRPLPQLTGIRTCPMLTSHSLETGR